jgi:hypothetical protein
MRVASIFSEGALTAAPRDRAWPQVESSQETRS